MLSLLLHRSTPDVYGLQMLGWILNISREIRQLDTHSHTEQMDKDVKISDDKRVFLCSRNTVNHL